MDAPLSVLARQSARIASQKPVESVSGMYSDPLGPVKVLPKSCYKVCNLGTERTVVTRYGFFGGRGSLEM